MLYDELRRIARQKLAELPVGQTLQATALVHEAWLRLANTSDPESGADSRFADTQHLRAATAQAMRWILVDRARRRTTQKRNSSRADIEPDQIAAPANDPGAEHEHAAFLRLDQALQELEQQDARRARIVLLRYFAGLSVEQTAEAMGLSPATVKRDWQFARAWLLRAMDGEPLPSKHPEES